MPSHVVNDIVQRLLIDMIGTNKIMGWHGWYLVLVGKNQFSGEREEQWLTDYFHNLPRTILIVRSVLSLK